MRVYSGEDVFMNEREFNLDDLPDVAIEEKDLQRSFRRLEEQDVPAMVKEHSGALEETFLKIAGRMRDIMRVFEQGLVWVFNPTRSRLETHMDNDGDRLAKYSEQVQAAADKARRQLLEVVREERKTGQKTSDRLVELTTTEETLRQRIRRHVIGMAGWEGVEIPIPDKTMDYVRWGLGFALYLIIEFVAGYPTFKFMSDPIAGVAISLITVVFLGMTGYLAGSAWARVSGHQHATDLFYLYYPDGVVDIDEDAKLYPINPRTPIIALMSTALFVVGSLALFLYRLWVANDPKMKDPEVALLGTGVLLAGAVGLSVLEYWMGSKYEGEHLEQYVMMMAELDAISEERDVLAGNNIPLMEAEKDKEESTHFVWSWKNVKFLLNPRNWNKDLPEPDIEEEALPVTPLGVVQQSYESDLAAAMQADRDRTDEARSLKTHFVRLHTQLQKIWERAENQFGDFVNLAATLLHNEGVAVEGNEPDADDVANFFRAEQCSELLDSTFVGRLKEFKPIYLIVPADAKPPKFEALIAEAQAQAASEEEGQMKEERKAAAEQQSAKPPRKFIRFMKTRPRKEGNGK